jgi:signal peptidase I
MTKIKQIFRHPFVSMSSEITKLSLQTLLFIALPLIVFTLLTSRTEIVQGLRSFVVVTGSMEPKIPVGSLIYTQNQLGYDVGDVIAFKNEKDMTVTHRIVGMDFAEGTIYKTKGDANNSVDVTPVPREKVIGKLVLLVPQVGLLMGFVKTPFGFGILIGIPVLLFIIAELWGIKKELEKEIEKKMLAKFQSNYSHPELASGSLGIPK